jgi:hypothetical protein
LARPKHYQWQELKTNNQPTTTMTTAIIATITSLTATAVPAVLLGLTDTASLFAMATIAVGTFIATWEALRTSHAAKN